MIMNWFLGERSGGMDLSVVFRVFSLLFIVM
jgi:hypothetical protein